jgi:hypothetical protein
MKNAVPALSAVAAVSFASLPARADFIGALAGGGTGLLVAARPAWSGCWCLHWRLLGAVRSGAHPAVRGLVGPMTHSAGIVACQTTQRNGRLMVGDDLAI